MEPKNDVIYLKYVLNFGKILGVFPMSDKSKVLTSFYSETVMLLYVIYLSYSIMGRCLFVYTLDVNLKHSIIDASQSMVEMVFVLVLTYQTIGDNGRWIVFFKYIQKLDQMNIISHFSCNTPKYKFILFLSLTFSLFVLLNVLDYFINNINREYYIIFIFTNIDDFYMTTVIYLVTFILNKRICYLNKVFLEILSSKLTVSLIDKKLDEILRFYQHYGEIVKLFNIIFGWPIFFYKPAVTLVILSCLDLVTENKNFGDRMSVYFSFACFYTVSAHFQLIDDYFKIIYSTGIPNNNSFFMRCCTKIGAENNQYLLQLLHLLKKC